MQPPFFRFSGFFYFLEAVQPAAIDSQALLSCSIPGFRVGQIVWPKRPGPALCWPDRIYGASSIVAGFLQKYAIFCDWLFDNCVSKSDALEKILSQALCRYFKKFSDELYFRIGDPDVSFSRPGAASAALSTFEVHTTNIPWGFVFIFRHRFHRLLV